MSETTINKTFLKIKHCINRYADESDEYIISKISNIKIAGSDITIGYEMATAIYYEDYAKVMNTN